MRIVRSDPEGKETLSKNKGWSEEKGKKIYRQKLTEEGKYQLEGLATTFVPFSQIEKVFQNMEHPDPAVKKTVILFD